MNLKKKMDFFCNQINLESETSKIHKYKTHKISGG